MSKSDLERLVRVLTERVASLEARLQAVEMRPVYVPVQQWQHVPHVSTFTHDMAAIWSEPSSCGETICRSEAETSA